MKYFLIFTSLFISVCLFKYEADCKGIGSGSTLAQGWNYIIGSVKGVFQAIVDKPDNNNSSIKYHVFTPRNPKKPCFLEPNQEALQRCPIDPKISSIFLIHGFIVDLNPGNVFEIMKDLLLANEPYNVIIVDWTKYDGPPYVLAIRNAMTIGGKVADLITYLAENAGISTNNVTIVGHSLGAHLAGAVGKHLPGLHRINGLDPAGPLFELPLFPRLSYTDADFVQVLHTSSKLYGLGIRQAVGHMDFFANGGKWQPHCQSGAIFRRPSGDDVIVNSLLLKRFCHHEIALIYYLNSINSTECNFLATQCKSEEDFNEGKCSHKNAEIADMGFYGQKIPDMPPLSRFYLRTSKDAPYCLKNGYIPR